MRALNAGYDVLRDPLRRAAYDRELLEQETNDDDESKEIWSWEGDEWTQDAETGGPLLARRQHSMLAGVGSCASCGAGLCSACFERLDPPACPSCMLAWIGLCRGELVLPVVWFFGVLAAALWVIVETPDQIAHVAGPTWASSPAWAT